MSPQGLKVLARAPVLENLAWTPPTLAGTTLYARDRKNIAAFELGALNAGTENKMNAKFAKDAKNFF